MLAPNRRFAKEKARTFARRAKNFQGVVLQRRTKVIVFRNARPGFARTQLVVKFLMEMTVTYVIRETLRM
jgi:hypothetical protein